jgi:hypothetical protein
MNINYLSLFGNKKATKVVEKELFEGKYKKNNTSLFETNI